MADTPKPLTPKEVEKLIEDLRRSGVRSAKFERWGIEITFDRKDGKVVSDKGWGP